MKSLLQQHFVLHIMIIGQTFTTTFSIEHNVQTLPTMSNVYGQMLVLVLVFHFQHAIVHNFMNVFAVYHLMQHYIIYQQLMHTVSFIIWCYYIQRQCLVLATHKSIGLMMCSLLWVVVGYWKMSSAIQSIRICEIVLTFTIS